MKFERTNSILHLRSKKELTAFAEEVFRVQGSMARVGVDRSKMRAFVAEVAEGYLDNPYHNFQHAVDTLYSMAWMLSLPGFAKNLPDFHKYMLLLVALVHDVGHPGHDNQWEVKTHSPMAQRYNNLSVIENHSLTITKELIARPETGVLPKVKGITEKEVYDLLDQLILCTDFSWHKVFLDELAEGLSRNSSNYKDPEFVSLVCRTLIKAADISNTAKPFRQAKIWGRRVMNEFWAQGEMEKKLNLTVGPMNDQENTEFNSTQAGFIKYAACELFVLLSKVENDAKVMLDELLLNQQAYERMAVKNAGSLKK